MPRITAVDPVMARGVRSMQDTVLLALWCAARHLDDDEEALWLTVSSLGNHGTTCAIMGGIVACHVGETGIPMEWLRAREPLTDWKA